MKDSITRSELINLLASQFEGSELSKSDISLSVREIINHMSSTIANGDRIEIRGFGSFTLRQRKPGWDAILKQVSLYLWEQSMRRTLNLAKT